MGFLDMFKKKEEQKTQPRPSPEETPINQALQMKERGLTNNQIIQVLQQQGYNPQQIYDALAQAEARQSIEPYTERQEPPREALPPEAPLMQGAQGTQEPQLQPQHNNLQPQSTEEIIESVIEEKWQKMIKELTKIKEWKDAANTRMERIEQQITDLKSDLDGLQKAIVARVGEYDKTLSEVGTDIKAMEKVFKDVLPQMTENIQELSKITKELKSGKKEETEETKQEDVPEKAEKSSKGTKLDMLTKKNLDFL
ncbi:hypothetical protein DRJ25_00465 [Candidatus Woesearchaeota archaeon]|nr:MAG: hypothetical protein DRJ25_00465 [Candidatus Woesearchaeota archaeon]